jgi:hypothetical protein
MEATHLQGRAKTPPRLCASARDLRMGWEALQSLPPLHLGFTIQFEETGCSCGLSAGVSASVSGAWVADSSLSASAS